jgi:23S rRNA (guanosine2251-2'-O)-methyltransferase
VGGEQVEGRQAVRELLLAGRRRVREVLLATDLDPAPIIGDIRELATESRVPIRELSRSKLEARARTDAPQGVVALAGSLPESTLEELIDDPAGPPLAGIAAGTAPFLLALDGVTDPGNLGALLRTASLTGVTGVVLPRHRAVRVTPAVTKAAAGAVEHLPIALVGGLPGALSTLSKRGVWVVGLDGDSDRRLWDLDIGSQAVCLVLGAEDKGLARLTRERCDEVVSIPMQGRLDSLNVAVAGALALYEVTRQRAP